MAFLYRVVEWTDEVDHPVARVGGGVVQLAEAWNT